MADCNFAGCALKASLYVDNVSLPTLLPKHLNFIKKAENNKYCAICRLDIEAYSSNHCETLYLPGLANPSV